MKRAIAKLIAKISELSILVNINTKHHVFLDIKGHVAGLSLRIYLQGWVKDKIADYSYDIYYWVADADILDNLSKIIDLLESLIKEG